MSTRAEEKEVRREEHIARAAALANQPEPQPRCVEVSTQFSGGGKVALRDFGKVSSNWGVSMTRKYAIPEDWTEEQVDAFQIELNERLKRLVEPIDQEEFDNRISQVVWED